MATKKNRRGAWCKKCQAPIRWVRTRSGSWIPLDESSDPAGRWVINPGSSATQLMGVELEHARETGRLLFTNHIVDCAGEREPVGGRMPVHVRAQLQQRSMGSPPRRARG